MKKIIASMIAFAAFTVTAFSQLKPFDRLARDNVTIKVVHIGGGGSVKNNYQTSWGSYDKTRNQEYAYEVSLDPKSPVLLEFAFVFRDSGGEFILAEKPQTVAQAEKIKFEQSAESQDINLKLANYRKKSGEKIIGWLARASRDGKVVGIAGSSDKYEKIAGSGQALPSITK